MFWPETFIYRLPGAVLNQRVTLVVAKKSETPFEPQLRLFLWMNDQLPAAGLLGPLRSMEAEPKKIWEAVQTLLSSMNDIQELVADQTTKLVFTSSPG